MLRGTRQVFLASTELYTGLEQAGGCDDLPREFRTECDRLSGMGFLGGTPAPVTRTASFHIMSLHLVHGCNLACRYCNVGQGTYGDDRSLMSPEVADAALRMFEDRLRQRQGVPPMLMLYGGEPLLNWPVLEHAGRRFRQQHPSPPDDLWLVTNATLMTAEKARVLRELDVLTIVSLDGPASYHDTLRPYVGGGGSHAAALRGLKHLEKAGARHVIRSTWTPGFGEREELLTWLRANAREAMQITVSADFHSGAEGTTGYHESVRHEWDQFELAGYKSKAPASSALLIDRVLRADWAPLQACPAGDMGLAITPSGEIYPCQVAVARKAARMGNVLEGGIDNPSRAQVREQLHLDDPGPACSDCTLAPFCAGPCPFSRPLLQRQHHCDTLQMELTRAFRFAARQPVQELVARYRFGLVTADDIRALERGAALRTIAWARNQHLRPLALCPNPPEQASR